MKKICSVLFCLFLPLSFVRALTLDEQREIYTQVVKMQEQGQWTQALQKSQLISQYPVSYLLDYQRLRNNFSKNSLPEVHAFIKKNSNHKISEDIQREYLYYLARHQYWSDFLSLYSQLPNSTDLKCYHFQAKIAQNKAIDIFPEVEKVWLSATSLPNACDNVFSYYLTNKKITQALIWQRFELAYLKKNKSLMSYLITLMTDPNRQLAKQLFKLNKNPRKLLSSTLFSSRKQSSYPLLLASIKQLTKKDVNLGMDAYLLFDKKIGFNLLEKVNLKSFFIRQILMRNQITLLPWADKELPHLTNITLIEQRIRYAIKSNNWNDIEYWIGQIPPRQQKSKWRYWQARVLERQKQQQKADLLFQQIASERTYYGFLAAQKLGLDYQFNAQIVTEQSATLTHLQTQLTHIEELFFQEKMQLQIREWEALLKNQNKNLQRQLGLYAYTKGWPHLSVIASIRSASWDALNIRFPEVKPELFLENANKYELKTSYIYAMTRQESSFNEYARSPAGAQGYMQLMPKTASETARKIGLKNYKKKSQLREGKINIQLGSAYFNMLLKRYKGNRILATAAYNAGPNRVDYWQANKKGRPEKGLMMDSWVETIPYKETRRYVKNVLAYNMIYQHILDKPLKFLTHQEINARF